MKHFNPAVVLLSIMGLAGGVLCYLDQYEQSRVPATRSSPSENAPRISAQFSAVKPLPGNRDRNHLTPPIQPDCSVTSKVSTGRELLIDNNHNCDVGHSDADISAEPLRDVTVHVRGLKNDSSALHVAVFDSAEGFPQPEHSRATKTLTVAAESLHFSLALPDTSTACVAIFQDLNDDGKLTKNGFGLPIEPYGFSNNARSTFGPPTFSQAAFKVSKETVSIEISVH